MAGREYAWLTAWDRQGTHRTATQGDEAGADWLASEAAATGAKVTIETFSLARVDPLEAFLDIDGTRIDGVPLFDAPDGDVTGTPADIAIRDVSPLAVYTPEFIALRQDAGLRAIVLITTGGAPGLALLNAERFTAPYGPPVLQVASEHRNRLLAARDTPIRVVTSARRTTATARNIVVTLPGRDRSLPPLVVMTPRSSWWTSTAERGGGLVCWLACLHRLIATPPQRDVILTANSGHELGHIGLDAFIARRPGWETTATWVHFGANIGAADSHLSIVSGHDSLRHQTAAALAAAGQPHGLAPAGTMPNGESRDIHRAGGRYITLVGGNPLFHLPQDRLPHAVNLPAVTRSAAAMAELAVALSQAV